MAWVRRSCDARAPRPPESFLVELLDHDDLLIGDALEKIAQAPANPQDATHFSSHCAQIREDGSSG